MGRRTLLSAELHARLCGYIEISAYDYIAAEVNGISRATFYRWMELGKAGRKPFRESCDAVRESRAKSRLRREVAVAQDNPLAWL